jgi:hypothetical protein
MDAWNAAMADALAVVCAEAPPNFSGSCDGVTVVATCSSGRCEATPD